MSHQTSIADSALASHISPESAALSSAYKAHESTLIVRWLSVERRKNLPNGGSQTKGKGGGGGGVDRLCARSGALWMKCMAAGGTWGGRVGEWWGVGGVMIHRLEKGWEQKVQVVRRASADRI